jgi:hypothetical protein
MDEDIDTSKINLNKVILPVIRQVMPNLIANQIIGVQPMNGPVGNIFTMNYRSQYRKLTDLDQYFPMLHKFIEESKFNLYARTEEDLNYIKAGGFDKFVYTRTRLDPVEITKWSINNFGWSITPRNLIVTDLIGPEIYLFKPSEVNESLLFKLTWG